VSLRAIRVPTWSAAFSHHTQRALGIIRVGLGILRLW
jgi:hypothetical protein